MAMTVVAASAPVSGYHNIPMQVPIPATATTTIDATTLTTTDWTQSSGTGVSVIVCESNGPDDSRLPTDTGQNGNGGLCTTGRNSATVVDNGVGDELPNSLADAAAAGYTKIDACSATTVTRAYAPASYPGTVTVPFIVGNADATRACSFGEEAVTAVQGVTNEHGWTAEVGIFSCLIPVPADISTAAPNVVNDYALVYSELYAWWSYDGVDDAGFHGHVSMFLSASRAATGASLSGSAEVTPIGDITATVTFDVTDDDVSDNPATTGHDGGSALVAGNTTNNCGASPSEPPSGGPGPVMRLSNNLI
jgi:hypothetical protein